MLQSQRTTIAAYLLTALALCAGLALSGCKRPRVGQPLAPQLRGPVKDLAAIRSGNQLWLTWTMPRKGVGKFAVNGTIAVRICRRENLAADCNYAGETLHLAPGAAGSVSEERSGALAAGIPLILYYSVELMDRKGGSTGLSNHVATLAGAPPEVIRGLTAEMSERGVLLRWTPVSASDEPAGTAIRLHRTMVILKHPSTDISTAAMLAQERDLWAPNGTASAEALDADVHSGATYEYTAQRVVRIVVDNQTLELAGQLSVPAQITVDKVIP